MGLAFALIIGLFVIRGIEVYRFIKKVSKVCQKYDWKVIDENPELLLVKMADENYHLTNGWSAYNFLFMKGPSPLSMFLNFKPLTIEAQYNEDVVNRINKYEII